MKEHAVKNIHNHSLLLLPSRRSHIEEGWCITLYSFLGVSCGTVEPSHDRWLMSDYIKIGTCTAHLPLLHLLLAIFHHLDQKRLQAPSDHHGVGLYTADGGGY